MLVLAATLCALSAHRSELWTREQEDAAGIVRERILSAPPRLAVSANDLPKSFSWADKDGKSFVTKSLNQHIPQVRARDALNPPYPLSWPTRAL